MLLGRAPLSMARHPYTPVITSLMVFVFPAILSSLAQPPALCLDETCLIIKLSNIWFLGQSNRG